MLNFKKKSKIKDQTRFHWTIPTIIFFTIFVLYSITLLGAIGWTFMNSLKTRYEYIDSVLALPKEWLFSNYITSFQNLQINDANAITMLFNSLWISVLAPFINLSTAVMASYVMSKYKFPGRELIYGIMLTCMALPLYGGASSAFKLYKMLGIYDSPLFLIVNLTTLGGSFMLIATFDGMSTSYMESGFVDGAGHFKIFRKIMLPQSAGILSALYIMQFIGQWNNYMVSIMYLPSYLTLSSGLYVFQQMNERNLDIPLLFAGALACMIPVMALYLLFQDKLMNLSFGGGVKG